MRTVTFLLSGVLVVAAEPAWAQVEAGTEAGAAETGTGTETPGCLAEPVVLKRFGVAEPLVVSLTDCEQRPHPAALAPVSALALPPTRKSEDAPAPGADEQAAPEPLLNPELLVRLQLMAVRFPQRAIEIVSGYRTRARAGSRHRSGDALDVRIEGVDNEELSIFARTLEATGVGYYPNSTFMHIDVRAASAYWVDRSGPGEAPDYVREVHGPELPLPDETAQAETAKPADPAEPGQEEEEVSGDAPIAAAIPAEEPAEAEASAEEPAEAEVSAGEPAEEVDPAELEAEIKALLERALVVMREANAAG